VDKILLHDEWNFKSPRHSVMLEVTRGGVMQSGEGSSKMVRHLLLGTPPVVKGLPAVLITIILVGCGGSDGLTPPAAPVLSRLDVSPTADTVEVGSTHQLSASGKDQHGAAFVTTGLMSWSSNNVSVALVDQGGTVTAVSPGEAIISASVNGISGASRITVIPAPVATVEVVPSQLSIQVGKPVALTAIVKDSQGRVLLGRTVVWSTSASGVASVDAQGVVTGISPGTASITAVIEGRSATSAVTVTLVPAFSISVAPSSASITTGSSQQFAAIVKDSAGNVLSGRSVQWTSSADTVAIVNSAGVASGVRVGTATITARVEGIASSAMLTVRAPVVAIALRANVDSVRFSAIQDSARISGVVEYTDGSVSDAGIVVRSLDNRVAALGASGYVRAVSSGTALVVINLPGTSLADTVLVRVQQTVATLQLRTIPKSIIAGTERPVVAQALDRNGYVVRSTQVYAAATWNMTGSAAAQLGARTSTDSSSTALIKPNVPGVITIQLNAGGVVSSFNIPARSSPVLWYDVSVNPLSLVQSTNGILYLSTPTAVSAFNPVTRTLVWTNTVSCTGAAFLSHGVDGRLYCVGNSGLAALSPNDGSEIWRVQKDSLRAGMAVSSAGIIVVRHANSSLIAYSATTGAQLWQAQFANSTRGQAASFPIIDDTRQTVYVGSRPPNQGVYALDLQTGEQRWFRPLSGSNGVESLALGLAGDVLAGTIEGTLTAISPQGGQMWQQTDARSDYEIVVDETGAIYAVDQVASKVSMFSQAGQRLWEWKRPGSASFVSWAVDKSRTLYVVTSRFNGEQGLIAVRDGLEEWTLPSTSGQGYLVLGYDGVLYFQMPNGLLAVQTEGYPTLASWPMFGANPRNSRTPGR
jgi:uncharacterized protein YjdB